jgi:hypothetical protein
MTSQDSFVSMQREVLNAPGEFVRGEPSIEFSYVGCQDVPSVRDQVGSEPAAFFVAPRRRFG